MIAGLMFFTGAAALLVGGGVLLWTGERRPTDSGQALQQWTMRHLRRGNDAFAAGEYQKALDYFRRLGGTDAADKRVHHRMGVCYQKLGQSRTALRFFLFAANGEDGVPAAMRDAAVLLYGRARFGGAGQLARKALENGEDAPVLVAIAADSYGGPDSADEKNPFRSEALQIELKTDMARLAVAHLLLGEGDLDRVEELLGQVGESPEHAPLASLCRAQLLWARGQRKESLHQLRDLVDRYSHMAGARVLFVEVLLAAGDTERALGEVERIRRRFSGASQSLLRLARSLDRHGHWGVALELAIGLTGAPKAGGRAHLLAAEIFLRLDQPHGASSHAERALENGVGGVEPFLLAGTAARRSGRKVLAVVHLKAAVDAYPESAAARRELGTMQVELGRTEAGLNNLARACELGAANGECHYEYGVALARAGRHDAAIQRLRKAADPMQRPYRAYTWLGQLAATAGRRSEAFRYFWEALRSDPVNAVAASNDLAMMLLEGDGERTLALMLAYHAHLSAGSSDLGANTSDTLARALIEAGYAARAVGPARTAVEARPEDAMRRFRLGVAERAAGNQKGAREALEKAVELADSDRLTDRARRLMQPVAQGEEGSAGESAAGE